jgi:hypothetical protein
MTESARLMRKTFHPLISAEPLKRFKPIYDLGGMVLSMFALNYLVVSFILRRLDYVWEAWTSIYFSGHVMLILPFLVLETLGLGKFFRKSKAE